MKKSVIFTIAVIISIATSGAPPPLTGIYVIPGSAPSGFPTIASAIAELNAMGVGAGGVTFWINTAYSETITATLSVTATGTASSPVVFRRNPAMAGPNPVIIAYSGGVGTPSSLIQDGIWNLIGSDYVTIDGIDLSDPNTTNPQTMEYGYGLFKTHPHDGCQFDTIRNCTVTLRRINNAMGIGPAMDGSRAINAVNSEVTTQVISLVPATPAGTNSYNGFYSNTLQNCNIGIALSGYAAVYPYTLGDTWNDVGGTSPATGNLVRNYGGGGTGNPAAGIRAREQWNLNISYNTVNNNDGGGVNHTATLRGIYAESGTGASATINSNNVTIRSAATESAATAIENGIGGTDSTGSVHINNNNIQNCSYLSATSGTFTGILNSANGDTVTINGNSITNTVVGNAGTAATCSLRGIVSSGAPENLYMSFNAIIGNIINNMGGTLTCIQGGASDITANGNTLTGNSIPQTSGNLTGAVFGIYNLAAATGVTYKNNTISNSTVAGTSSSTNHTIAGISTSPSASSVIICRNNSITSLNISVTVGSGVVTGIRFYNGSVVHVNKNRVANLSSTGGSSSAYGIAQLGGDNWFISNNMIGGLKAPTANSSVAIAGLYVTSGTNSHVYYNTVYLDASSSGAHFGTAALYASTNPNLTLRNNILVNISTPAGSGLTVAYRRNTTTLGTYMNASDNNLFFAGPASASNLIFYDGTNSFMNLTPYKAWVAPRDASAVRENPPFINVATPPYNLHINPLASTLCESGAARITTPVTIPDDIDDEIRWGETGYAGTGTAPDIGADEFGIVLMVVTAVVTNVTCYGGADGAIALTVTGGVSPYTYLWSNGATTSAVAGLNAGAYNVTVTDAANSFVVSIWQVGQPSEVVLGAQVVNATCPGSSDGSIDLTVTGGTPGYTYLWSTGASTQDIINLQPQSCTVTVTDNAGCTKQGSYNVGVTNPVCNVIQITGVINTTECREALTTITLAGSGSTLDVIPPGDLTLFSGQNILLKPGVHVQPGGIMHGIVVADWTGPYCIPLKDTELTAAPEDKYPGTEKTGFILYPNPSTGNFVLELKGEKQYGTLRVEIYGMRGDKVLATLLTGEKRHEFSLPQVPPGLYFVRVVADGYAETFKLVLTR